MMNGIWWLPALLALVFVTNLRAQLAGIEHVVVIGCDGMSPDGVQKADAPVMRQMMSAGAWTMHARGVFPTSSSPNWASMIMGASPVQHGITSNDWETNKYEIEPIARGTGAMFPTIFGELRRQHPAAGIACFHDWDGFGRLFEREAVDRIEHSSGPTNALLHALEYFKDKKPAFLFVHLDHVDHAGHQFGHGTPEYYEAVGVADKLIGMMLAGIREAGLSANTMVLVTADHGGVGKKHGGFTMAELEIPWILIGTGVRRGHEIKTPMNTYDTALTIAWILGVKPHPAWIGRPILEAFGR